MLNQYIATIFFSFMKDSYNEVLALPCFLSIEANEAINFQYLQSEMEKSKNSIAPIPQINAIK